MCQKKKLDIRKTVVKKKVTENHGETYQTRMTEKVRVPHTLNLK